jgi:hypothetical protein
MNPPRGKSSSRKSESHNSPMVNQSLESRLMATSNERGMFGNFTDSTWFNCATGKVYQVRKGQKLWFLLSATFSRLCVSQFVQLFPHAVMIRVVSCGINRLWFDVPCQRSLWFSHILSWAVICLTTGRLFELGRLTHAAQVGSKIFLTPMLLSLWRSKILTCGSSGGPQSLPLPGVSHPPSPQSWLRLKTGCRFSEYLCYFISRGLHSKGYIS